MTEPQSDQVTEAWRRHRPYLVNLAYQMLGDVGDAEDVAQEAFLRLSRADINEIDDVRGWLTVVAGRLCLDQVRSARARHERPEDLGPDAAAVNQSRRPDPADRVTLDDEIRTALLEILRRLSPGERVSFVLHDVFGVPFDAIAETVGRPVGTCRQLARRARAKFSAGRPKLNEVPSAEHQLVTEKFITACANGDLQGLAAVLDPTVWGIGTQLVDPAPPPQVNHGPRDVATNLLRYLGPGVTLVSGPAGQPVVLAFAKRQLFAVIVLSIGAGLITKIEATADPVARARAF
ncbi:RNA polymerase sigma factor SigI [Mycobacterium shimoidei]|uniref:Putative alternative RNA polymerase sigma factor SigI [Mycobacterium tuberculosis H37Rv] n=1 Tax=Mycobacterium shimoidei TaxID=29313 RepID=A0A1E3TLB4_MYCSH|nr:RNA polymerase sigma factor SigI [Mycobacterium shimoidei]MCV7258873.1 RNA polymerase sigma factor SigI [Mycobacterium shimoidei]ODR15240.1 RNA polymerase subunit sigma [Mycobacterium shimoidei]ORW79822.1 RNA polymerase subunit sigma [Mycobacterium shimoidei]SRX92931.1 putative alternative RNA polymerase sigma factor SigI [Mycobacterium tuberculosis H37Rv] [Mycobacterium shimoidei]